MGYSFRLAARVLLNAPYHGLCYSSRGALAGTSSSSMGPPHEGSIRRPMTPWANALTTALHLAPLVIASHTFVWSRIPGYQFESFTGLVFGYCIRGPQNQVITLVWISQHPVYLVAPKPVANSIVCVWGGGGRGGGGAGMKWDWMPRKLSGVLEGEN